MALIASKSSNELTPIRESVLIVQRHYALLRELDRLITEMKTKPEKKTSYWKSRLVGLMLTHERLVKEDWEVRK